MIYWVGHTLPFKAALKAVRMSAENICGGSLLHSLTTEAKKKEWRCPDVISRLGDKEFAWLTPEEAVSSTLPYIRNHHLKLDLKKRFFSYSIPLPGIESHIIFSFWLSRASVKQVARSFSFTLTRLHGSTNIWYIVTYTSANLLQLKQSKLGLILERCSSCKASAAFFFQPLTFPNALGRRHVVSVVDPEVKPVSWRFTRSLRRWKISNDKEEELVS